MFPEGQYQNGLPVYLEIWYRVSRNIAVQKCVCIFCNCSYFYKKYITLIVWKPAKLNKNANTLLFLLLFTKSQREKNIEKTFFVSAVIQKGKKTAVSGNTLPQYLPNPKIKFPVKFIIT